MVATAVTVADRAVAPRLWPGGTVACFGAGPGLTQADADYVRGKVPVIAINNAVLIAPWADVFYSSDNYWLPNHKGLPDFHGLKFAISLRRHSMWHPFGPDVTVLANTGVDGLELSPDGLRTGQNSGYACMNLAVHFGAARILLLGYNLGPGHHAAYRTNFTSMVEPLKAVGVDVINCTPGSALHQFPKMDLREALA